MIIFNSAFLKHPIVTNSSELTVQTQPTEDDSFDLSTIELREIKAHGCFGVVWKAQYADKNVAVKIFTNQVLNSSLAF